jgi:hypothetical protein
MQSYRFVIVCESSEIAGELDSIFFSMKTQAGKISTLWYVGVSEKKDTTSPVYFLLEDEKLVVESDSVETIIEETEWAITLKILESMSNYIQIHASGIVVDEKALLVPGPPGSGKSILTYKLLLEGFSCFSDEIIFIEPKTLLIHPFPRSLHIEHQMVEQFPQLLSDGRSKQYLDASGKLRFNPSSLKKEWVAKPSHAKWIIFPDYDQKHDNELIPIGHTEATSLLIGQAINLKNYGSKGVDVLLALVKSCNTYLFKAGNIQPETKLSELLYKLSK